MIKNTNEVISNYSSQITGFNSYITNNNLNRSKCVRTKNYKEGLVSRIKSKISSKKESLNELQKKREKMFKLVVCLGFPLLLIPSCAFAALIAHLLSFAALMSGLSSFFQLIFGATLYMTTMGRAGKKIQNLDEEILNDEKECASIEAEIARIQATIDKIDMSNKFTEDKIAIIRDAIKQIEEMTSPEGAQMVVQVEPANGVRNSDNIQFNSSNTHNLVLN